MRLKGQAFKHLLWVGGLVSLTKFIAIFSTLVISRKFGVSEQLDAYVLAITLPAFVVGTLGGALAGAFLPAYLEAKVLGKQAQTLLLSSVSSIIPLIFVPLLLLMYLGSRPIMGIWAPGYSLDTVDSIIMLTGLLAPTVIFSGMAGIYSAALNSELRFRETAISQAYAPLLIFLALLTFPAEWGFVPVVLAATLASIFEYLTLKRALPKYGLETRFTLKPCKATLKLLIPRFSAVALASVFIGGVTLVDQIMAAAVGPGAVSLYMLGTKIPTGILGILTAVVGSVMGAYLSKQFMLAPKRAIRYYYETIGMAFMLGLFFALVLFYYSAALNSLLYGSGKISSVQLGPITEITAAYAFIMVGAILWPLLGRTALALNASRILLYGALCLILVKVVLSYILSDIRGVSGLALASSIAYAVSVLIMGIGLHFRFKTMSKG